MAGPSDREAAVRLTLGADDYLVNIRKVGAETEKVEQKMVKASRSATLAWGGAKNALGQLASSTGNLIKTAGGLAGAFSLGSAAMRAVAVREQFKDLEEQVGKTGVTWTTLMKDAEAATKLTGKTTEQLGAIYKQSFEDVGDVDYAKATMIAVGQAAKVTGRDMGMLATVAGTLNEKFGATPSTLPDMLATVISKTGKGGAALESLGAKFAALAGEAVDAGFTGDKGMSDLLGALNALDDRLQDKSIPAFKKLFQTIKDGSAGLKELQKQSGLKLEGKDGLEKIRQLIGSDKGRKALEVKLGGDMRVIADQIAKPFDEAFEATKKATGDTKKATDEGLKAFDAFIAKLGEKGMSGAEMAAKAAERAAADPRVKLEQAMDKVALAFTQPKMLGAIDKLADKLPALADWLAKLLEVVVDHPLLAAGAFAGGTAAKGAAGAFAKDMMANTVGGFLKDALWKATVKPTTSGAGGGMRGPSLADFMPTAIGVDMGESFVETVDRKGSTAGKKIGNAATEAMGETGGLTKLGKALAVVAAAELAYELGKVALDETIDPQLAADDKGRTAVALANAAAAEGIPIEEKMGALEEVKGEVARLERQDARENSTVSFSKYGAPIAGGGFPFKKAALGLGNMLGIISDDDAKTAEEARSKDLERARARMKELESQIAEYDRRPETAPDYITNRAARDPATTVTPKSPREIAEDTGLALARRLRDETLKVRVVNIDYVSHGTLDPEKPKRKGYFDLPITPR